MNKIKEYLDNINSYTYNEYLEAIEKNEIIYENTYNNGIMFIRKNPDSYGIRVSFNGEVHKEIYPVLKEYSSKDKKTYFIVNSRNTEVCEHLNENTKLLYHSFEMIREDISSVKNPNIKLTPYQDTHFDDYIDILGKGFTPIREQLNLEPYNWYIHNQEESRNRFNELKKNNNLFGYYDHDELIGVIAIEGNEVDIICVREDYQGKGFGKKLLEKSMFLIKQNGHKSAFLSVLVGNDSATTLYQKSGFRIKGSMSLYIQEV